MTVVYMKVSRISTEFSMDIALILLYFAVKWDRRNEEINLSLVDC
jgi:hypothetical protein